MCTVFYALNTADHPKFVLFALDEWPPMSVHEFGVGKGLREIDALMAAVKNLQESCKGTVSAANSLNDPSGTDPSPSTLCVDSQSHKQPTLITKDVSIQC